MVCLSMLLDPFYKYGLSLIPTWVSKYIQVKVRDEITYSFSNFNGATIEGWDWISNFIVNFTRHVITYLCWD